MTLQTTKKKSIPKTSAAKSSKNTVKTKKRIFIVHSFTELVERLAEKEKTDY